MKKVTLIICFIYSSFAFSQENNFAKRSEELKSGNRKDVLHNFYQFALKNFSTKENAIEFNSTIFAVKSAFNKELLLDTNFVKETFTRNFQVNIKLDLDGSYNYKGFSAGATYAVWNARDKQIVNLANTAYSDKYEPFRKEIRNLQAKIMLENKNDTVAIVQAIEDLTNNKFYDKSSNKYYDIIIKQFSYNAAKSNLDSANLTEYVSLLSQLEEEEFKRIEAQPLWTISADGSVNKDGKFNKASLNTVFLKGFGKSRWELDLRANLNYADTITFENSERLAFNSKAGLNYKAIKINEQSIFEIKGYCEYNSILKNVLPDEKRDTFLANAEFRIRLNDELWLPITVKYDIENSNVLGFLNITYNFEPLDKK